jgi:pullulanase-type alpha-1,6-glucosidase
MSLLLGSTKRHTIRRTAISLLATATLVTSMLTVVPTVAAAAEPVPPGSVTLAGSLQSEIGCAGDWDAACEATDLELDAATQTYAGTFDLPAGNFEFKIAINHAWTENYGQGGVLNGPNIPLVLQGPATITFGYNPESHRASVTPTSPATTPEQDAALAGNSLRRDLTREQFYFVMADRFANGDPSNDAGGLTGDKFVTGLDPADKAFYHGGDLKGITNKLDYLKGLGTTSIWMTPSFKNKPVQGGPGQESAGYHGYWITDFTQIDPHLGTNEELKALIDAAHAKGMKVFFDIITNHTADVISYQEPPPPDGDYPYISKTASPFTDVNGTPFDDLTYASGQDFPKLDATSFPYTPMFPTEADKTVKVPAWLNDPTYYHNRGNANFDGTEGDVYGDFVGLDDLFTAQPAVRDGLIDIYKTWAEFGIDGFRIDTVKHVNIEFWQKFSPEILKAAAAANKPKFFMFGEVYDGNPKNTSRYTTAGDLQATLDFGFQLKATGFAQGKPTTELRDLFALDDYYTDTNSNVYSSPTFLGNHDMGRIGNFLKPSSSSPDELLQRDELAHSLMYLTRGQPVVYYGDEQGFVGDGGDQLARQDMFPSQVDVYNDDDLIGTDATTKDDNFDTSHPLYQEITALSKLRKNNPALADGAQIHRYASSEAGIYAFSRIDQQQQFEYIVAANNSTAPATATFDTFSKNGRFRGIWPQGSDALDSNKEGRVTVTVPPLSVRVWKANTALKKSKNAPAVFFKSPGAGGTVGGRAEVGVSVPAGGFNQVTLAWRPVGTTDWAALGTDDNAPYRVFHDVSDLAKGTLVEYRAVLKDNAGHLNATTTYAVVGDEPAPETPEEPGGPVTQPEHVTVAGSLNSEMGCLEDWQPACEKAQLTLDPTDQIWKGSFTTLPGGDYAYKAAINKSWDENYGAGGVSNGGNIPLTVPPNTTVTFYYDHRTHLITSNLSGPIITAVGSFQGEIGCQPNGDDKGDWQPDCMTSWLQDPDGDGTYTYATSEIPAGDYEVKVAHNLSWDESYGAGGIRDGANIGFSVQDGQRVTFRYVLDTHVLTVTTAGSGSVPDLAQRKAQWIKQGLIAWDLPLDADTGRTASFRLHYAPEGGLTVDAEAVTGGSSIPLTFDPAGLPADVKTDWPHLAAYDALRLAPKYANNRKLLTQILSGQVAIAEYDDLGLLVDATGVQLPGVLDDLYSGATQRPLGLWWVFNRPILSLWAPTAKNVTLLVDPPGAVDETRVPMGRDQDGIWTAWGNAAWTNGSYLYEVEVFDPIGGTVVKNLVTDPYSVALTENSKRSVIANLGSAALTPKGWSTLAKPALAQPEDSTIYELQVRDFSISDNTIPATHRGTYLAFTDKRGAGMQHLKQLADAGLNTVHLLPAFDIATIEEIRAAQQTPACDLPSFAPDSDEQQACVTPVAGADGFNWGYDPLHYTAPEGSYATNPDGAGRTKEFRQMVAGLNGIGLRVVMDVVYNHTAASGQAAYSVLDKVVPGYYQRLSATGAQETSTCCANTATEHAMMEKLMIDSVVTWAKQYKVDGFRFDLMGHHSKQNMLNLRAALDTLTVRKDGVDGKKIFLYGEGWNFGEVANDARFVQATQANMAGTGIATFSDRLRDAVRGGGPFDDDPRIQGFGSGLSTDPNGAAANGAPGDQQTRLLHYQDLIKVGLTGNLADYSFEDSSGNQVTGAQVDYNGSPAGYTEDPSEVITYVDAHDNETLFDALTFKLPVATSMDDRVRMNTVSLATTALSQGPMLWHAGNDLLRSKSLDRNSYDSGDWFNRIDWTGKQNTFGSGLPPETDNSAKWPFMKPLLANPALKPAEPDMGAATNAAQELLQLRFSSPLFRLGSAELIQQKVSFPLGGTDQQPGVIVMVIDDTVGPDLDPQLDRIVVVFNATPTTQDPAVDGAGDLLLSPIQAAGSDDVVKDTGVDGDSIEVPARTVAVLVQPQS